MSAELWRSEAVIYAFMALNMAGVLAGLAWAWRRGWMFGDGDGETPGLGPDAPQDGRSR